MSHLRIQDTIEHINEQVGQEVHIWTHPGLQGQVDVTARRITTARIYTACSVEDTYASRP